MRVEQEVRVEVRRRCGWRCGCSERSLAELRALVQMEEAGGGRGEEAEAEDLVARVQVPGEAQPEMTAVGHEEMSC